MAWSPDGSVLAFSTRVGDGYAIHTVRPADGSIARLTEGDRLDRCPTYSPDGRRIAFVSAGRLEDGQEGAGSIWVMDADGRNLNHVANGLGGSVTLVDWSPALPAAR